MSDFIARMRELEGARTEYDKIIASKDSINEGLKTAEKWIEETVNEIQQNIISQAECRQVKYKNIKNTNMFGKEKHKQVCPHYSVLFSRFYKIDPHIYGCEKGIGIFTDGYDRNGMDGYIFCHESILKYYWEEVIRRLEKEKIYPIPPRKKSYDSDPIFSMNTVITQKKGVRKALQQIEKISNSSNNELHVTFCFPLW